MSNKASLIVKCKKCEHLLYIDDWTTQKKLNYVMNLDCPKCGQSGWYNWILYGFGDLDSDLSNNKVVGLDNPREGTDNGGSPCA